MRLDELDVRGLGPIDVEAFYRRLGLTPRGPIDVTGEVIVEGTVPASKVIGTYRLE